MKIMSLVVSMALVLVAGAVLRGATPALASFHCMRIHAVMAGYNGASSIQFVELRMNTGGQSLVSGHKIEFFDASGTLKATFTFPSNVTNGLTGDSILVATQEFNDHTPDGDADFVFTTGNTVGANGGDPAHPIQGPDGLVHFARLSDNCDGDFVAGAGEVDSVGYGTASAHFGSAAVALPSPSTAQGLRLNNLNLTPTANNTEYGLAATTGSTFVVATGSLATDLTFPRNNARRVLPIQAVIPSVGGVSELPGATAAPATAEAGGGGVPTGWLIAGLATAAASVSGVAVLARGRLRRR